MLQNVHSEMVTVVLFIMVKLSESPPCPWRGTGHIHKVILYNKMRCTPFLDVDLELLFVKSTKNIFLGEIAGHKIALF